jgi:hypothetical protein
MDWRWIGLFQYIIENVIPAGSSSSSSNNSRSSSSINTWKKAHVMIIDVL